MEKELGTEVKNLASREIYLRDNCSGVEEISYMKKFSPSDLAKFKEELVSNSIEVSGVLEEKTTAKAEFQNRLKPLMLRHGTLVNNLKQKAELVKENCYKFVDQIERKTGYYNSLGELIEERPSTGDELDPIFFGQIPAGKKKLTGTNDK